jgi:hypothetical protein
MGNLVRMRGPTVPPAVFVAYAEIQESDQRPPRFSPGEDEALDDLADGLCVLGAECDTRVLDSHGIEPEEVLVLGEEDTTFGQAVNGLLLVDRSRAYFRRRRDIDAAARQTLGDGLGAVLIQVEANQSSVASAFLCWSFS